MKNVVRFLAVVVMLISIVTAVGCSSGSNPTGSVKDRAVSMMQVLPSNVSQFSYLDVYTVRTDKNLASVWASLSNQSSEDSSLKKVNGMGSVYAENINLVVGYLSLDQLVGNTSTGSYDYGGFKVKTYANSYSAVTVKGVSIASSDDQIRGCIDVASGKEASLYSNEDLKAVFDRLPAGYEMGVVVIGNVSAPEGFSGLLAAGISGANRGGNDVEISVYKFNGSDAAQQYVALASNKSPDTTIHIDRTQDGAFVTEVVTYLTPTPTATVTSQDEAAYNVTRDEIQNAVTAYAAEHSGILPTINGTYSSTGCPTCQVVNMSALLVVNGGMLQEVPEGCASINGSNNDNCDAGNVSGCFNTSSYVWAVDGNGSVYSICIGPNCSAYSTDGYQGVWP